jgi:DNA-binding NtrC family response regulator
VTGNSLLLIEDEPDVACLLVDFFGLDGWHVETASNGREALAKLRQRSYDVIVSDLLMPELDGTCLYREVGEWRPELLPRFIFISGFDDTEVADFIKQTRAPILSKPFRFDEIRKAIGDVLGSTAPSTR